MPRVTAVVLTYNGRELLERMLASLIGQDFEDFAIIVVDDGSTDGTAELLRKLWPNIRLTSNSGNLGVAASLNRGVCAASSEYVALLNNDLELEPGWLGSLVQTLDRYPEAASATGKLLDFYQRDLIEAAGDLMRWSGMSGHRGQGALNGTPAYEEPTAIFSPCAGAALYRRSVFADVGLFDEKFVAYLEDIDWGFRAQLAGYTARYEPAAVAYHVGGATTGRQVGRFTAMQRRNSLLVVLKNYPATALVRHLPAVSGFQFATLAASGRDGILGSHLRGLGEVVLRLPSLLRQRNAIQRSRRVTVAELNASMTAEVYASATFCGRVGALVRELWRALGGSRSPT